RGFSGKEASGMTSRSDQARKTQMARLLGLEPPQFRNSLDSGKGKIIDGSRICNELGFEYQYPDPLVMPLE
ncbi:hypothetical protein ACUOCP_12565, partial [Escherichia sp. R-CC3]